MAAIVLSSLSAWELGLLTAIVASIFLLLMALFPRVGIVRLQLAGSGARATFIVEAWDRAGRLGAARRNVLLDFPFLATYSALLVLVVLLADRAATASGLVSEDTDWPTVAFALAGLAAGACDALENWALLGMLKKNAQIGDARARVAWVLALAKFASAFAALAWSVGVLVASAIVWIV